MPVYEHFCHDCGEITEVYCKVEDRKPFVQCKCGGSAERIISASAVRGDDMPQWMRHPEVLGCLQNSSERKVQTRSEYNALLKERNIVETSKYSEF